MANAKFNEFRQQIENSVKAVTIRTVYDIKYEEQRLQKAGWRIAGPFEKRIRALRAARAAYKAVIETH